MKMIFKMRGNSAHFVEVGINTFNFGAFFLEIEYVNGSKKIIPYQNLIFCEVIQNDN